MLPLGVDGAEYGCLVESTHGRAEGRRVKTASRHELSAGHSPSQQMCSLRMIGFGKHSTSVERTLGFLLQRRSQDDLSKRQVLTLPSFNYNAMIANENMLQTSICKAVRIQVPQLLRTIAVRSFIFLGFSSTTFQLSILIEHFQRE